MPQNFVPSFTEVWLQAAQVINQQNALRQRAEEAEERMALREKYQDDINKRAAERNKLEAEKIALQSEVATMRQQNKERELDDRERRTAAYEASVNIRAAKDSSDAYGKGLTNRLKELNIAKQEADALETKLDADLIGPTGDATIDQDPGLIQMDKKGLENLFKRLYTARDSGVIDQMLAAEVRKSDPSITDPTAALEARLGRVQRLMQWRQQKRAKSLETLRTVKPDDKNVQFLQTKDYLQDALAPRPGEDSIQKAQGDQAKANAGAVRGPADLLNFTPGTSPVPPPGGWSPDTVKAFEAMDSFSPALLSSPEGLARGAETTYQLLRRAKAVGDRPSAEGILRKAAGKGPAFYNKLLGILESNKGK